MHIYETLCLSRVNGPYFDIQVMNKEGVMLYLQFVDGQKNGEEVLDFALPLHRIRIAPLGSFTGVILVEGVVLICCV